jgi:hypothetical protein
MEILILPILVFIFVIVVIVLFNRLANYKKKTDKAWNTFQIHYKKQQEFTVEQKRNVQFSDVENARKEYNKTAARYNRIIQTFPTSLMANMVGYQERQILDDEN